MVRGFLRHLRFAWPDILTGTATRNQRERELNRERIERAGLNAKLLELEIRLRNEARR